MKDKEGNVNSCVCMNWGGGLDQQGLGVIRL